MSLAGISSSNLFSYQTQNNTQKNNLQQFKQDVQQLGEDLASGNLTAAQTDFAAAQQVAPQSTTAGSNPNQQSVEQLASDLKSGNLSGAQQDFSQIQQQFQKSGAHGHHHHHGGGGSSSESSQTSELFQELGQDLQAGNVSGAQQIYTSLQQEFSQLSVTGTAEESSGSSVSGVSVTA